MKDKKLCVVIPYRDRESHLKGLLPRLKESIEKDSIPYQILVVEQEHGKMFNRGMMKNIGGKWALENKFDYVCFHDVDMVPVPTQVDYSYEDFSVHLAVEVQQFGYKLPYPTFFGGVLHIPVKDFEKTNGYNNNYWSWGAEDDDFFERCNLNGIRTSRKNCRFDSFDHIRDYIPTEYTKNIETLNKFRTDPMSHKESGLNNLSFDIVSEQNLEQDNVTYKKITVKV
jgi:predicted glycosyltransferase involved in capsule biosynthesis